jgi:hypothetical protein
MASPTRVGGLLTQRRIDPEGGIPSLERVEAVLRNESVKRHLGET